MGGNEEMDAELVKAPRRSCIVCKTYGGARSERGFTLDEDIIQFVTKLNSGEYPPHVTYNRFFKWLQKEHGFKNKQGTLWRHAAECLGLDIGISHDH